MEIHWAWWLSTLLQEGCVSSGNNQVVIEYRYWILTCVDIEPFSRYLQVSQLHFSFLSPLLIACLISTLNFAKRSRQIKSQAKPNVRQIRVNLSPDIPIPDMPAMHHPYATRQAKRKALEMIEENLPPAKRTRGQICNRQSKMPLKEAHDATPSNTPDIARPQKKRRKLRSRTAAAAAPPHPDDVIIMTRKEFEQKCEEIVQQRLKQILKDYTPRRQPARARRR